MNLLDWLRPCKHKWTEIEKRDITNEWEGKTYRVGVKFVCKCDHCGKITAFKV